MGSNWAYYDLKVVKMIFPLTHMNMSRKNMNVKMRGQLSVKPYFQFVCTMA